MDDTETVTRATILPAGPAGERVGALDGLRAIAVLAVFVFHGTLGSAPMIARWYRYIPHLGGGVDIFFVLSGYLISRPFVAAHLGDRPLPALGAYVRRRILRIYPAYVVALVVLWRLDRIGIDDRIAFLKHAALVHSYFRRQASDGLPQSWTLVVEVTFYAAVPLWAAATRRAGRLVGPFRAEWVGASGLVAVGLACRWWDAYRALPLWVGLLPSGLATLGVGMLLAALTEQMPRSERLARLSLLVARRAWIWWVAAAATFWLLGRLAPADVRFPIITEPTKRMWQQMLQPLVATLLVAPVVLARGRAGVVEKLLRFRPLAYVGLVSYSVYLWHLYALGALGRDTFGHRDLGDGFGYLAAGLGVVLVVASASYYLVERPAMRLARHPLRFAWSRLRGRAREG